MVDGAKKEQKDSNGGKRKRLENGNSFRAKRKRLKERLIENEKTQFV